MRRRWWAVAAVVVVAAAGGGLFVATRPGKKQGSTAGAAPADLGPVPDQTITTYLADWSRSDWNGMVALVAQPPPDFVAFHQKVMSDLQVAAATYTFQAPAQMVSGTQATANFDAHLRLRGLGDWSYSNKLFLTRQGAQWQVSWSPQTIYPDLALDRHFTRTRTVPTRASILAHDGTPLTSQSSTVYIGIEPSHIKDKATVVNTLVRVLGADAKQLNAALAAPGLRPDEFVPVEQVTDAQFVPLRPVLAPVPGIVFQHTMARLAATPDLAAHVVGHVGPATAEQLAKLGDLYEPGDMVGQSGIELVYESMLRGTPSGQVSLVDGTGATVSAVKQFTGTPGQPVTTTLDLATQKAAEKALDGVANPAALVAVQPSTGDILAVVARPVIGIDRALESAYPPGSTFKIITSTALLGAGATLATQTTCPPTVTIDGKTFSNFENESSGALALHRAFAMSCNTAFIQLADKLPASALSAAAAQYGFNTPLNIGVPAVGGSYPTPVDEVEKVASAIGQARVTASPLQMATVAAAVDAGVWRPPHLAGPALTDSGQAGLAADVDQSLRALMAEVVTSGTGTAAALPGGVPVSGKTGTAEFGTVKPLQTHAWFVGFRGDLAFSVLVEAGGVGGRVAAPLAAKFLTNLTAPVFPAATNGRP
jgi:cell division protein FtsI/penicillin-binding protein 2